MGQPRAGSDVWMLQTARARPTFPLTLAGPLWRGQHSEWQLRQKKKREEGEIKK